MTHITLVIRIIDQTDTGCTAAFNLVLQAGSRTVAEKTVVTLANFKELLKKVKTLLNRPATWEGSKQ